MMYEASNLEFTILGCIWYTREWHLQFIR